VADWVTIASLATAGGTPVPGVAILASARLANRAARGSALSCVARSPVWR
jgi:hypothetical protein